jgi:DNA mismatch repair protein MutH
VRRDLDQDISRLGTQLKVINIAGVPLLLTVVAVAFALSRARRRREESKV